MNDTLTRKLICDLVDSGVHPDNIHWAGRGPTPVFAQEGGNRVRAQETAKGTFRLAFSRPNFKASSVVPAADAAAVINSFLGE